MSTISKLATITTPLSVLNKVAAINEDSRMCFYPEEYGHLSHYALCCDGRGQNNECCGISDPKWCKDISAQGLDQGMTVSYYKDDKGLELLASVPADDSGGTCASYLSEYYISVRRATPRLEQCSVRSGPPPSRIQPARIGPASNQGMVNHMIWGRADRGFERCWQPSHVKWTDLEGKVWWGHIKTGKLEQVMERLERDDLDSLDPHNSRDGGPLLDAISELQSLGAAVLNGLQEQEQYSSSSSSDESS